MRGHLQIENEGGFIHVICDSWGGVGEVADRKNLLILNFLLISRKGLWHTIEVGLYSNFFLRKGMFLMTTYMVLVVLT